MWICVCLVLSLLCRVLILLFMRLVLIRLRVWCVSNLSALWIVLGVVTLKCAM